MGQVQASERSLAWLEGKRQKQSMSVERLRKSDSGGPLSHRKEFDL